MFIQTFRLCGTALFLGVFLSSCSVIGLDGSEPDNACKWNRNSCMYEGRYEPNERDFAEEEAKRLNKVASERLRRSSAW